MKRKRKTINFFIKNDVSGSSIIKFFFLFFIWSLNRLIIAAYSLLLTAYFCWELIVMFAYFFSLSQCKVCKPVFAPVYWWWYCVRRIKAFAFCGVFQPFHLKPVWRGRAGRRNPVIVNKKTILSEFFSSITFRQYQRTNTHPHTNTLCAVVSGFLMKAIRRLTFKPGRQSLPLFQHTRTNQNTNICVYVGAEQGCVNRRYMSVTSCLHSRCQVHLLTISWHTGVISFCPLNSRQLSSRSCTSKHCAHSSSLCHIRLVTTPVSQGDIISHLLIWRDVLLLGISTLKSGHHQKAVKENGPWQTRRMLWYWIKRLTTGGCVLSI